MNEAERSYRRGLLAIILIGALLRLVGLNWDEGRGLHPDEANLVHAVLTLGVNGRLIPAFHAYNDLSLWLPRLLSWPFCGADDAACVTLAARLVSALASVAAIALAAGLARALAAPGAARVAGLATAIGFAGSAPLVQWAHFGTTESMLVLLVIAAWRVAVLWQSGRISDWRMALWTGAILGPGFGIKTTAVLVAVVPITALLLAGRPGGARLKALMGGVALAALLALVTTPSLIFAFADWVEVMRFEGGVVSGALPVFWTAQFQGAASGWYELRALWLATSGVGLLLAGLGLLLVPRHAWRLAAPGLVFALIYAFVIIGWDAKFIRYLAPLIAVALVFAGVGAGHLITQTASKTLQAAAVAGLGLMALAGLDQAAVYLRPDPRLVVEAALMARAAPQDIVALEPHDLAQTGALPNVTLPLMDPKITPEAIAAPLAKASWLIIASRRNWAVLPRQPDAAPVICAFYARLLAGDLGYRPVVWADRAGPLGKIFAPSLRAEETRTVFDRPDVILWRKIDDLPEAELAHRLGELVPPGDCAPDTLAQGWRRRP